MRFNLLSDAHWESKVGSVLDELSSTEYRSFFKARDYGDGLNAITVVFVCQAPDLNLKKRVRFETKEKKIYLDIMLDLDQLRNSENRVRKRIISEQLAKELPEALRKYSITDFDRARFVEDLSCWLKKID